MARSPLSVPEPAPLPPPLLDEPDPSYAVVTPLPVTVNKTEVEMKRFSTIDKMKRHFAAQPKRRIKIRKDVSQGDVPVQVNGYTFLVMPDVYVEVPEQVAQILEESGYI